MEGDRITPGDSAPEIARVLDLNGTMENLGGDPELYREILDFFMEMVPQQLDDLEQVQVAGDVAAVDMQAHAMKGGAANVGAVAITAAARELELLAKNGSLEGAADLVAKLRADFEELQAAYTQLDWNILS